MGLLDVISYHHIICRATIRTGQEISLGNMAVSVSRPTQWEENVVDLSKPVLVVGTADQPAVIEPTIQTTVKHVRLYP